MGANFKTTGPGCCCDCIIYKDSFATDSLSGSWTQESGSWSIAGGVLSTDDHSAVIVANTAHPDGDYQAQFVKAKVRFEFAGDIARLILAYDDVDNYLFVEFSIDAGCGHIQMYHRFAGSNGAIGPAYSLPFEVEVDEWTTVSLCYMPGASVEDPGTLGVKVQHGSSVWFQEQATAADIPGDQGGLGTGSGGSGTIDFDDFSYQYHYDAEDHPNCPDCEGGVNCLLHEEHFQRADSTSVGCAWEAVDGDWSIDANELTIADPDAILLNRTQLRDRDGDVDPYVRIQFTMRCEAGAIVRVILDYADTDNYFYVRLEPGYSGDAGRVTFWRLTAGVETQVQHDSVIGNMPADESAIDVAICWRPDGIVSVFIQDGVPANGGQFTTVDVWPAAADPYVALGTGASGSAQVWFDDFYLYRIGEPPIETGGDFECSQCDLQSCGLYGDVDYQDDLWSVEAGSWTPSGGHTATSSSDAMLLNLVGHPQTTGEGFLDLTSAVYCEFATTGYSNIVRGLLGVEDSSNYLYGEVEFAADSSDTGWVRVGKVEAGVETMLAEEETSVSAGQPNSGTHSLRVCYDGLELRAIFTNSNGTSPSVPAIASAGTGWNPGKSGIATGSLSAAVTFGQFYFYHDIYSGAVDGFNPFTCTPCVPSIPCGICGTNAEDGACTDRSPQIILLRMAGIVPGTGPGSCADAVQFNDTFALPLDHTFGSGAGAYCVWLMHPDFCLDAFGNPPTIQFQFQKPGSGDTQVQYEAKVIGASGTVTFQSLLVQADFPAGQIFNPTCLDEPAAETVWGLDCLTAWADWTPINESVFASGLLAADENTTAYFKVLA